MARARPIITACVLTMLVATAAVSCSDDGDSGDGAGADGEETTTSAPIAGEPVLAERNDQLAFYGRFKLNTYIYAPKDDPYPRDRWRDPYPDDLVDELRSLVEAAAANHVRFTFAVSPGVSICYSEPADIEALTAKLGAVYDLGVRV